MKGFDGRNVSYEKMTSSCGQLDELIELHEVDCRRVLFEWDDFSKSFSSSNVSELERSVAELAGQSWQELSEESNATHRSDEVLEEELHKYKELSAKKNRQAASLMRLKAGAKQISEQLEVCRASLTILDKQHLMFRLKKECKNLIDEKETVQMRCREILAEMKGNLVKIDSDLQLLQKNNCDVLQNENELSLVINEWRSCQILHSGEMNKCCSSLTDGRFLSSLEGLQFLDQMNYINAMMQGVAFISNAYRGATRKLDFISAASRQTISELHLSAIELEDMRQRWKNGWDYHDERVKRLNEVEDEYVRLSGELICLVSRLCQLREAISPGHIGLFCPSTNRKTLEDDFDVFYASYLQNAEVLEHTLNEAKQCTGDIELCLSDLEEALTMQSDLDRTQDQSSKALDDEEMSARQLNERFEHFRSLVEQCERMFRDKASLAMEAELKQLEDLCTQVKDSTEKEMGIHKKELHDIISETRKCVESDDDGNFEIREFDDSDPSGYRPGMSHKPQLKTYKYHLQQTKTKLININWEDVHNAIRRVQNFYVLRKPLTLQLDDHSNQLDILTKRLDDGFEQHAALSDRILQEQAGLSRSIEADLRPRFDDIVAQRKNVCAVLVKMWNENGELMNHALSTLDVCEMRMSELAVTVDGRSEIPPSLVVNEQLVRKFIHIRTYVTKNMKELNEELARMIGEYYCYLDQFSRLEDLRTGCSIALAEEEENRRELNNELEECKVLILSYRAIYEGRKRLEIELKRTQDLAVKLQLSVTNEKMDIVNRLATLNTEIVQLEQIFITARNDIDKFLDHHKQFEDALHKLGSESTRFQDAFRTLAQQKPQNSTDCRAAISNYKERINQYKTFRTEQMNKIERCLKTVRVDNDFVASNAKSIASFEQHHGNWFQHCQEGQRCYASYKMNTFKLDEMLSSSDQLLQRYLIQILEAQHSPTNKFYDELYDDLMRQRCQLNEHMETLKGFDSKVDQILADKLRMEEFKKQFKSLHSKCEEKQNTLHQHEETLETIFKTIDKEIEQVNVTNIKKKLTFFKCHDFVNSLQKNNETTVCAKCMKSTKPTQGLSTSSCLHVLCRYVKPICFLQVCVMSG